ncbi:CHAT domain-containing protein [Streptomyces lutosisoli]|uniref:CHAT domain-containing protein n=1 Tax=Streptomyces lutosisoli TaxID=2665721 RepID=A0ABW2VNZ9_9ACTN
MDVDFQVEVGPRGEDGYPVVFRAAGGEEAPGVMRLPPLRDLEALAARVPDAVVASSARVRRAAVGDEAPVRELGRILFDALLAGTGSALLMAARNRAAQQGGQVRLVLRVQPPELARLPWEFMYDTGEDGYLGLDLPLVRHPQVARPVAALRVVPPLRILGMVARPDDQEPLAAHAEQQRLREALADLVAEGRVELGWVAGQTWRDLRDAVRRDARTHAPGGPQSGQGGWHVLHFIGHGGFDARAQEGTLALAGEQGGTHFLGAGELAMLLAGHPSLRLAVLNACESGRADALNPFSSVAGALMRKGMPAVLAMQYEVSDEAALECARTFYEALARQLPIDVAVMEARQAMSISRPQTLEWGTPVLYMRSLDGNGHLFDLADDAGPGPAPDLRPAPDLGLGLGFGLRKNPPVKERADLDELYAEGLGALYTDRWDQAVEAFRTVIAHDRDYRDSQAKLTRARQGQRLAALYAAATEAVAARDWEQAVENLQTIVTADPGHRDAQELLEQARREQVTAQLRDEIATLYRAGHWEAVLVVAERMRQRTQDADAEAELVAMVGGAREALETAARDQVLAGHYREALDHLDAGRWQRAVESLAHVRAIDPDYRDTTQLTARARQEIGRTSAGISEAVLLLSFRAPGSVHAVALGPDGTRLAVGCSKRTTLVIDERGTELVRLRHGMFDVAWSVAFSSDGFRFATAGIGTVQIWDADTGAELFNVAPRVPVYEVALHPDGVRLATACNDNTARVWDIATGAELLKVTHTHPAWGVAFSPDGLRLATASGDNTARVWDAGTGAELLKIAHTKTVYGVAYSSDGLRLATACSDNVARVWDANTGAELLKVTHDDTVRRVAFSPDGLCLATASEDNTARVWDAGTGAELLKIAHTKAVNGVAFSSDGRRLATAGKDKTVQLWSLTGGDDD